MEKVKLTSTVEEFKALFDLSETKSLDENVWIDFFRMFYTLCLSLKDCTDLP